ncbi:uncharacterized protein J7T55_011416 [Diaporthe amygdali]|uniref:uncharacterized protein n=1 Tax=Phomopsis amygdali TaxID=1214568 RepID=UPI0022FE7355|nr:uncharacterized protein J7T55_011416 [Diaporthe amygdali]KAJ0122955.1 uncharacterized protein J7T55_011416 [Diaporthe amygdali]
MPIKTYVYKNVAGSAPLELDVHYQPGGSSTPKPIAIYYHGGNFVVGNKSMIQLQYVQKLLDLGFGAVVSPDYRLSPTISAFDGAVTDSRDSYAWAQTELPSKFAKDTGVNLDPERMVTWGHSAGGALALLIASMAKPPRAILDLCGLKFIQDKSFRAPAKLPPMELPGVEFRKKIYEDVPPPTSAPPPFGPKGFDVTSYRNAWLFGTMKEGRLFDELVPDGNYDNIDPAVLLTTSCPPTFFVHGSADTSVNVELSERAHKTLKEKGVESELIVVNGAGHAFDQNQKPGDPGYEAVVKGLEFLRAHT